MPDPTSNGTKRKTSPRGLGKCKKPKVSAAMKLRWQDPEYRERQARVRAQWAEDRKTNPQHFTRHRVPDGMRKHVAVKKWAKAEQLADRFITMLKEQGDLPSVVVPDTDAAMAEGALREAYVMAVGPGDNKIKTANIRTILDFTKSKPESKSKITVDKAEDWLAAAQAEVNAAG